MYRQSFSTRQEEDQDSLPTGSAERDFLTRHSIDSQISPVGFNLSPTIFHQQDNLTTSFGSCTHTSSIDMTQAWAIPQQQYTDPQSQSLFQQGLPPLVPRLSVSKSLGSDEGDDTSEPASPRDNASERRKEVSQYLQILSVTPLPQRPKSQILTSLLNTFALKSFCCEPVRTQDSHRKRAPFCGRIALLAHHVVDA
jgi:hypothetical protein